MTHSFFKFPATPHLALLGDVVVRGDKVMAESERRTFLSHEIVVEEKVDGANLGISFDEQGELLVQNRGAYLAAPYSGQWHWLKSWLTSHESALLDVLSDRFILFGEWCYAVHSVYYERLPDWFLAFDVYDRQQGQFLAHDCRSQICSAVDVCETPLIARGRFALERLANYLAQSQLGDAPAEGLYMRFDDRHRLVQRAKLVRPDFIQAIGDHWARAGIRPNRLAMGSEANWDPNTLPVTE